MPSARSRRRCSRSEWERGGRCRCMACSGRWRRRGWRSGHFWVMIGSRAFMGVAQAGLVPVGASVMSRWFPRTAQASASGAFSGFMSVGSIIAAPLTAWLVVTCGWRWMFVLYAVPGVLWALWFAMWYRNQPSEHPAVNEAERNSDRAHRHRARQVPPRMPCHGSYCISQSGDVVPLRAAVLPRRGLHLLRELVRHLSAGGTRRHDPRFRLAHHAAAARGCDGLHVRRRALRRRAAPHRQSAHGQAGRERHRAAARARDSSSAPGLWTTP